MSARRYSQNILDWEASEGVSFLYACTHMVLVASALCDHIALSFLSVLVVFMSAFAAVRLVQAKQWGLFKQFLPRTVAPVLRWGGALAALAAVLQFARFYRLEPNGLWGELVETAAYLVIILYVIYLSAPKAFSVRSQDVVQTESLLHSENRMYRLYFAVLVRLLLHKPELENAVRGAFLAYALFLNAFVWRLGFQAAKFE